MSMKNMGSHSSCGNKPWLTRLALTRIGCAPSLCKQSHLEQMTMSYGVPNNSSVIKQPFKVGTWNGTTVLWRNPTQRRQRKRYLQRHLKSLKVLAVQE
eukprot:4976316-Karenia_brevis.AAC.1